MAHKSYQRATRPLIRNVEEYSKIMAQMSEMLLDYLTHSSLPTPCKAAISLHLSQGEDASGLVHVDGKLYHGFQMEGECPTIEIWALPIKIENQKLMAVWAVDSDKYYIQDTPIRIRTIA